MHTSCESSHYGRCYGEHMLDNGTSPLAERKVRLRKASNICLLVAAGIFFCSAALQCAASLQRWVIFSGSLGSDDLSVEDHVYDYYFPWYDWVAIGTAAQLLGVGLLIQAVGILVMTLGVLLLGVLPQRSAAAGGSAATAPNGTGKVIAAVSAATLVAAEVMVVLVVAGIFTFMGTHALLSGMAGIASPLYQWLDLAWLPGLGLIILAVRWLRRAPAASAAALFLIGSSMVGYLIATSLIAPVIAGQSHDTARWTETVVAASTAAAALMLVIAARKLGRERVDPPA